MISKIDIKLRKYLQIQKNKEELSLVSNKIEDKINLHCDKIQKFLKNANMFLHNYSELYSQYCSFNNNGMMLFNGNVETVSFTWENFEKITDECVKWIISICKNPQNNEMQIRKCCMSYNTLLLLLHVKDKLKENGIRITSNKIKNEIELYRFDQDEDTDKEWKKIYETLENNDQNQAIEFIKQEMNSAYCEGNIVYGLKRDLEIFSEQIESPVFLQASQGENAVFIKTSDEEKTSRILDKFLPGLFERTSHSYKPGNYNFAFIEKTNINDSACGRFCDRIKHNNKIESCLYHLSAKSYNEKPIKGIASTDEEVESLVFGLFKELDNRKKMSRLARKSICEFNEENPYEMLSYIILVINTFSDLFVDTYHAKDLYGCLRELIKNGGKYGIFVLCVGRNLVVEDQNNFFSSTPSILFDLEATFDHIVDYENNDSQLELLSSSLSDSELFGELESKLERNSSLTFSSLIKRTDIEIPSFYNEDGTNKVGKIAIPIGISGGKVSYFQTEIGGNMVSTIITGGTGSGKTTFIRSLIMSGSYFYSPDQVQFYIIDFKSLNGTADFACFSQDGGNAYVPNVRFLSERSNKGQAFALFNYIKQIEDQRSHLFIKYGIENAQKYREMLYREMQKIGSNNYANYAHKLGKNAIPALPQIFLVIDEANSAFAEDDGDLMSQLSIRVSKIRSYGISFILCGQRNPVVDKNILNNIGNRIALAANEESTFLKTFSAADQTELESGFRFVQGQKGKAVIQFGGQTSVSFVSTAYLEFDKISVVAKLINEKYADDIYNWTQQRPGSSSVVSADVLINAINDQNSAINNGEFEIDDFSPLYVGINSLSSIPHPIVLGAPDINGDDVKVGEQQDKTPHNYCVYAKPLKQIKIIWNMAFYLAYFLKKYKISPNNHNISINYVNTKERRRRLINAGEDEGTKILHQYRDLSIESGFDEYIQVNESVNDISRALCECYDIYRKRKYESTDDDMPYLFCLAKADKWISEVGKNIQNDIVGDNLKSNSQVQVSLDSIPNDFIKTLKIHLKTQLGNDFDIDSMISSVQDIDDLMEQMVTDENLKNQYLQIKSPNNSQMINSQIINLDENEILKMLGELLKDGAEQNVYVVFAYESADEKLKNEHRFINVLKWKNLITDVPEINGQEYDENLCYCKRIEVRLWDFLNSSKWHDFIKKF